MDNIQLEQQFDLSNASRDGLHLVLATAKDELVKYIGCHERVKRYKKLLTEEKGKIKLTLYQKIFRGLITIIVTGMETAVIVFVAACVMMKAEERQIFITRPYIITHRTQILILIFIFIFIALVILNASSIAKERRRFQQTVQENIKKYEIELAGLQQKEQEAINGLKAFLLIPENYADEYALTTMLQLIDNRRADNWKEVTALYEEHLHRTKIEDAARKTAENSRLQAEYARQTRNATRSAAAGAWASAAGIFLRR